MEEHDRYRLQQDVCTEGHNVGLLSTLSGTVELFKHLKRGERGSVTTRELRKAPGSERPSTNSNLFPHPLTPLSPPPLPDTPIATTTTTNDLAIWEYLHIFKHTYKHRYNTRRSSSKNNNMVSNPVIKAYQNNLETVLDDVRAYCLFHNLDEYRTHVIARCISAGVAREVTGVAREVPGEARDVTGVARVVPGVARDVTGVVLDVTGVARDVIGVALRATGVAPWVAGVALEGPGIARDVTRVAR
ncbi:hypothetical protein B566_EDAN004496 [Ephemera danica]|nr:hypothetical protein B566_EDAN004496 [Ephemera danica]